MPKDSQTVLRTINKICIDTFNNSSIIISESTSAKDIAEWDSMTNLFLIDAIEKEFNVKFSLDEILNAQCIGDICKIISERSQ